MSPLRIFFGVMLVPIVLFVGVYIVCSIVDAVRQHVEIKRHRAVGDTWLEPTILTAELAKHGYYCSDRSIYSRVGVLQHGMWKSNFNCLMEAVKDVPSSEVRCAILTRKLCAWRILPASGK